MRALIPLTSAHRRPERRTVMAPVLLILAIVASILGMHSVIDVHPAIQAAQSTSGNFDYEPAAAGIDHSDPHVEPADAHKSVVGLPGECAAEAGECCTVANCNPATPGASPNLPATTPEPAPAWRASSWLAAGIGVETAAPPRPPSLTQLSISRV